MNERAPLNLTPEQFAAAFPFHLVVDTNGQVQQSGAALRRLGLDLDGRMLTERLELQRPRGFEFGPGCFKHAGNKLFVFKDRESALKLRGELVECPGHAIALLSPWVQTADELSELGLKWSDMPTHDPTRDLVLALQVSASALESQTQLAEHLRQQSDELRVARDEAHNASLAKSRFLANISHEIRTPLNGIIATVGLVSTTRLDAEQTDLIRTADTSANHLLGLLNDVIDAARIEADKLELNRVPISLAECLEHSRRVVDSIARRAEVEIRVAVEGTGPDRVMGDSMRIQQVLINVIGNAIKFSPRCTTVDVRLVREAEGAVFTICDRGCGMTSEQIEQVLDPFVQADTSTTRKFGGAGLGLAISNNLVSLMGGELKIESAGDAGTTVYITIPSVPAEIAPVASTPTPQEQPDESITEGSRVLLVEDNAVNAKVARKILERLGCLVSHAVNGEDALHALHNHEFDLVLMDMQMPVMDGPTATSRWREFEMSRPNAHIPIIALTANASQEDRTICEESGMDGFLTKPIRMATLGDAVRHWLTATV